VTRVNRNGALLTGALAGAAAALFLRRRLEPRTEPVAHRPPPDPAEELRRKLAEARATAADEEDFDVAGMGAETIVAEEPRSSRETQAPPADEFEAMRRRVHEEGRTAAEQMRREPPADEI
jgi:hypothetical protein